MQFLTATFEDREGTFHCSFETFLRVQYFFVSYQINFWSFSGVSCPVNLIQMLDSQGRPLHLCMSHIIQFRCLWKADILFVLFTNHCFVGPILSRSTTSADRSILSTHQHGMLIIQFCLEFIFSMFFFLFLNCNTQVLFKRVKRKYFVKIKSPLL